MKLNCKKAILFLSIVIASVQMKAQDYLGFGQSNYAGVTGITVNPASIVDDRMEFDMTLFGLHTSNYNNYIGLKKSALAHNGSIFSKNTIYPAFNDSNFIKNYTVLKSDSFAGKAKSMISNTRLNLFSFMVYGNHKQAFAFTWDVRNFINLDGVEPEMATLAMNEFVYPSLWVKGFSNKNLSVQQMAWSEYGFTYGHVLKEEDEHYFKVAGKLKLLQGLLSAYAFAKDLKYEFKNDTTLSLFQSEIGYGHSDNFEFTGDNKIKFDFWKHFASYPGLAIDFGAVYEYRPDYKKFKYDMDGEKDLWRRDLNKYKYRIGFTMSDLGSIKYKKAQLSNNFNADIGFWNLHVFDTIKSVLEFDSLMKNTFAPKDPKTTYKMNLPLSFSLQFDYNIWKDFYVNVTPFYAVQFKNNDTKVHDISNISVTPRWDHRWFGVFAPVSYNALSGFRYGATVRLGPLIFGTTNLGAIFGKTRYGADLHVLLKIPIPVPHPHDKDKDGISNKKDKCKDVPGTWEFMGCPDRDGDHVEDSKDKCPDQPGLAKFEGCPDKDDDGIIDSQDECIDIPGLAEFKGCPDTDKDGIPDKDDECPDVAGLAQYMGCPDKDGDGLIDKMDDCPDEAGLKEFNGCPDRDGDKVMDKNDKCPDEPGTIEMLGCPWKDNDKDGIKNEEDACPDVAGPIENKGCPWPDTDKDGVADREDECVNTPGPVSNKGCPEIKKEEKEVLEQAFSHLEFATGKDIIKPESFASLDALAKLLKEHSKDWTLLLSGHTDNQGDAAKNLLLSKKRTIAVQKYLIKHGVNMTKVKTEWFGQTKPIASNDTEEGRQRNRRVEMKVIFK